jgi:hypothetical protein
MVRSLAALVLSVFLISAAPAPYVNFLDHLCDAATGVCDDPNVTADASFRRAIAAAVATKRRTIRFPAGDYRFKQCTDAITATVQLVGDGPANEGTIFYKEYTACNNAKGLLHFEPPAHGSGVHRLAILAQPWTNGGPLISAAATSADNLSDLNFSHLRLAPKGDNLIGYAIRIDGCARTADPTGVRHVTIDNVAMFGATGPSLDARCVHDLTWTGTGTKGSGSTTPQAGAVSISGTTAVTSTGILIAVPRISGGLILTNVEGANIMAGMIGQSDGYCIRNTSSVRNVAVKGVCVAGGVVGANWQSSVFTR